MLPKISRDIADQRHFGSNAHHRGQWLRFMKDIHYELFVPQLQSF